MISNALIEAAGKLGFKSDNVAACGVYDKYLVSLYNESSNKAFYINYLVNPDADYEMINLEIGQKIKEVFDDFSIVNYASDEGGMTVEADCPIPKFFELLDYCISIINQYPIIGYEKCTCCGAEFGDRPAKKIRKGTKSFITCEGCALETIEKHNNEIKGIDPPTKKQKTLGTVFSIIGGLISIILYILLYTLVYPMIAEISFDIRYIFCIIGFAGACLSYYGYTIFVKKDSKRSYVIVSIISVISAIAGQYLGYVGMLINTIGGGTFPPVANIYLMPLRSTSSATTEYSSAFYVLLAISALFAACGCVIFLIDLYEKNHKPKEEISIETVNKIG